MLVYVEGIRQSGMVQVSEAVGFPFRGKDGEITQVIYQDNLSEKPGYWDFRSDRRTQSRAIRRTYIDIGCGIPEWDHCEDKH